MMGQLNGFVVLICNDGVSGCFMLAEAINVLLIVMLRWIHVACSKPLAQALRKMSHQQILISERSKKPQGHTGSSTRASWMSTLP